MFLVSIVFVLLLGSFTGSAMDFVSMGYRGYRAKRNAAKLKEGLSESMKWIDDRYIQIASEREAIA